MATNRIISGDVARVLVPAASARHECPRHITIACIPLALFLCVAAVIDRVAVVVGKTVITESEVLQEVRLTEFLNNQPLDLGPKARRDAAERMVDQQLIRTEMAAGNYPKLSESEAKSLLEKFRQERYPATADFQAALATYGITREQLQQRLAWQVEALRFTDLRFPSIPAPPDEPGANGASPPSNADRQSGTEQQLDAWLQEARSQTRIQFRKEAFQ
ncbi:MAG TPA: hypothetical protein VMH81_33975 [Bryobacteraceae bacterium]|nr:hypothetical protein [Bryobacteraceae bacterium]